MKITGYFCTECQSSKCVGHKNIFLKFRKKELSMKRILCWLTGGHKRGKTFYKGNKIWHVECKKCGFTLEYSSPCVRLVGTEIRWGFDGN